MNVYRGKNEPIPYRSTIALYVPVHLTRALFGIYSIEADVQVL